MRRVFIALSVLAALAYFNAVGNPFVHDDVFFILQNPKVHHFAGISEVFHAGSFSPGSVSVANSYYRPLLDVIYRLEYWLFGNSSAGYHLVNIVLHLANAFLIYLVLASISRRKVLAACVSMVFLVHPVQSEAVACISGISNLMFGFFLLVSFLLYMRIADRSRSIGLLDEALTYSGALFIFGCALLSKEQAIVLPGLLALYELCFVKVTGFSSFGWRLRLAGFVIVSGGYFLWRKVLLGGFLQSFVSNWGEFYLRLKSLPAMIMNHVQTVFWPVDLHYYRSYDILSPWVWPMVSFLFLIVACILVCRVLPKDSRPLYCFGLGWFVVNLLPTTSIVPLVHEYSLIAAFEHFVYLPLAGLVLSFCVVLDYFLDQACGRYGLNIKRGLVVLFLAGGVFLTTAQTRMWAGEIPLFEKAVKYEPGMGRLRLLLAGAYYSAGDFVSAKREYEIAREIMTGYLDKIRDQRVRPFYVGFLRDSLLGLGAISQVAGDYVQAQGYYNQVLALTPEDTAVLNNLGVFAVHLGQSQKAAGYFKRALSVDPNFAPSKNNLDQLLKENP